MYKVEQYYIIKVIDTKYNWIAYKLGQERFGRNRAEALVKKYQSLTNIKAEILHKEILPHTTTRYITDTRVREELVTRKLFDSVDQFAVKGHLEETDGITEFLYNIHNYNDGTIISTVQTAIKALSLKNKNFTGKLKKIDNFELHYNPDKKHLVCYDLIKIIERFYGSCISKCRDKSILLIGQFDHDWVASFAINNTVCIMHDSAEQQHQYKCTIINDSIKYIKNFEELINLDMDFDIIIANPPYEMGNQITKNILDNISFDTYVNLMPLAGYKSDKLFQHVSNMELIDPALFEDAKITDNLNIAILKSEKCNDIEWEDFEIESFDPKFKFAYDFIVKSRKNLFYQILPNMPNKYNVEENILQFDSKIDFMITTRTAHDGVHSSKDSWDIRWNINKELVSTLSYMIRFPNMAAKENFCKFWYNKKLSQKLIKGLNKDSGNVYAAIPNIDWSRTDVEYTDEYVLEQMGLKWNENKDGVEEL